MLVFIYGIYEYGCFLVRTVFPTTVGVAGTWEGAMFRGMLFVLLANLICNIYTAIIVLLKCLGTTIVDTDGNTIPYESHLHVSGIYECE